MAKTSIEWTEWSLNPIRARHKTTNAVGHYCEKISAGCTNCYSSALQRRFQMPEFGSGQKLKDVELFLDQDVLKKIIRRKKPTTIFWCDMTDIFGEWVPDTFIDQCFAAMALSGHHTHQVLTKRADRMSAYLRQIQDDDKDMQRWANYATELTGSPCAAGVFDDLDWPLPNVWAGVSVENQEWADKRIPYLLNCPAAVRFLSCEPLLGPIDLSRWLLINWQCSGCRGYFSGPYIKICPACGKDSYWTGSHKFNGRGVPEHPVFPPQHGRGIDWVICGGESGPGARPCDTEWIRSIVKQCAKTRTSVFCKQLGANVHATNAIDPLDQFPGSPRFRQGPGVDTAIVTLKDRKGGDIEEFPLDLRVRQMPEPAKAGAN